VKSVREREREAGSDNIASSGLVRLAQQHAQLQLKPLFFEVPLLETDPLFMGRHWLLQELRGLIEGSSPGALISGSPGAGKTALVLQLVDHSCFGRKRDQRARTGPGEEPEVGSRVGIQQTGEKVRSPRYPPSTSSPPPPSFLLVSSS
jgi:hypothetical protein